MAGTDPKKTRDLGRTSEHEDYDADEDPLVELARIVSEDGGFSGRMMQRPRVEPAAPAAHRGPEASDLEAELLDELETSFPPRDLPSAAPEPPVSAKPDAPAPAGPAPAPPVEPSRPQAVHQTEPAQTRDDPDDLLRSIEEQLSQFEQRVRSDDLDAGFDRTGEDPKGQSSGWSDDVPAEEAAEPVDEMPATGAAEATWAEYRFRGPAASREARREAADSASAPDERLEVPTSAADAGAAAEVFGRPASRPSQPRGDYADETGEEPLSAGGAAAWAADELPGAPDQAFAHGREAEAGPRELSGLEAELTRELDSTYNGQHASTGADEDMMGRQADMNDDARGDEHGSRPGSGAAAVIAPEHSMRPPPRARSAQQASRGRSRKGLVTAAAVVLVVLIGGAAAMYVRSLDQGPSGPPPVIAAPEGPVKVAPAAEEQAAAEETVGQSVYDQVAGRAPETEENVVEGAEEPRDVERIVLPQSQADNDGVLVRPVGEQPGTEADAEAPAATGEQTETAAQSTTRPAAEAQGDAEEFGPRRVPTYVVRPDGTIVSTAESEPTSADAAGTDLSGQEMAAAQTEAMDPKPVQTVTIDEPRTAGTPGLRNTTGSDSPSAAEDPAASTMAEEATVPPPAREPEEPAEAATEAPTELAGLQPTEETASPPPAAAEEPVEEVASAPVPPTAASGYLVQLSAQTSEGAAEATFADLQQRYASVLGDLDANIQRADLGDRGIYYRVRVGPWAERAEAVQVCEALQAAGGDCYVTQ